MLQHKSSLCTKAFTLTLKFIQSSNVLVSTVLLLLSSKKTILTCLYNVRLVRARPTTVHSFSTFNLHYCRYRIASVKLQLTISRTRLPVCVQVCVQVCVNVCAHVCVFKIGDENINKCSDFL